MTIRANHLTVARILLLPLPCWLLYQGTWERMWALALFAVLGLTDYFDGLLARRQGATPLGKLLDPIADKIFVTSMAIPLVDLGIMPLWMIWMILGREYLVTELRRALSAVDKRLPVTELAKIKTTLQMTGFGLMVMIQTFPGKEVAIAFLSGALAATSVLAATIFLRFGEFTSRMRTALGFMAAGLTMALLLPPRQVLDMYGAVILGITLFSAAGYIVKGLPVVASSGLAAVARVLLSLAAPLIPLAFLGRLEARWHWIVLLILCVEFVAQGIDTWGMQSDKWSDSGAKGMAKGAVAVVVFGVALFQPWLLSFRAAAFIVLLSSCAFLAGSMITVAR